MSTNKVLSFISSMDHRYLFIILISITVAMTVFPFTFPIKVAANTQDYFNYIENMKPGDIYVYDCSSNIQSRAVELKGPVDILVHLFAKPGIKILAVSFSAPGPINMELELSLIPERFKQLKTYGVDFVYLGYIPGDEAGIGAFATNIRSVKSTDYYGNPIDSLPMMVTGNPKTGGLINDASAFRVIRFGSWSGSLITAYARIFGDTWGVPIITGALSLSDAPYYPKYIVVYLISGQYVEYEALIEAKYGYVGVNMAYYAISNIASALFVALILSANAIMFLERYRKKTEAVVR